MSDTIRKDTNDGEGWHLLDVASLEHVGYKYSAGNDQREKPDFSLFKKLYEETEIKDQDRFKLLYDPGEVSFKHGSPDDQFVPMDTRGKSADRLDKRSASAGSGPGVNGQFPPADKTSRSDETVRAPSTHDGASGLSEAVEKSRKEGYARGLEQGMKEGAERGFEQGLADGEKKGREEGEKKGYAAGAEKGEQEAREAGDKEARRLIDSLETMLLKTEGSWEEHVKRYEGKMIALIGRIAEKVVQARVKVDRGVVRESIVHALGLLPEPEEIVLQVSEDDYEYIDMIKEDFFERIKTLTSISVVANSGINRGGCKIESRTARVETDVESRLKAVFDALLAQGAP
ncbi:MAG: FliH/SctL family protein [Desulfobacterium sp.]|nr:FliH/SctL family protein [Desulfobacterium sp.]